MSVTARCVKGPHMCLRLTWHPQEETLTNARTRRATGHGRVAGASFSDEEML